MSTKKLKREIGEALITTAGRVAESGAREVENMPRHALPGAAAVVSDLLEGFWEVNVARELGVARPVVSKLRRRHLLEGEHWSMRGNAVVLTASGLARIKDLLLARGLTAAARPTPPESKETPKAGPPERVKMRVARLCPNVRLLVCQSIADGPDAVARLVRVKENVNFMPGMVLEAVSAGANLWQFTGRMPRRKGRW